MSYAIRAARRGNQGDPGLFGFIGDALGTLGRTAVGAIGGLATGGVAGGILGAIGAATRKPISVAKATAGGGVINRVMFPGAMPTGTPPLLAGGSGVSVGPGGVQIGTFNGGLPVSQMNPGTVAPGSSIMGAQGTKPCVNGRHYNKTGYFTKRYGFIEKGSVCVKNRKRNPLNPRALSRAMSRVKSAQKAVKCLQLFAGPAARASAKGGGKRKSSGRSCKSGCR